MNITNMNNTESFTYSYSDNVSSPNVPPHFHNSYEILYFQSGDAVYMVEGNEYNLKEGDILITNPRELHCPIFKSDKKYVRSLFFLKPSYLSEFITTNYNPFSALEKRKIGTQNKIDTELVRKYELDKKMDIIGSYFYSDLPEKNIMIKTHLLQFLVSLNKIVTIETTISKNTSIDDIVQFLNDHLEKKISLNDLENKFHLTKYHISHIFKEKMGFTVLEYLTYKRILLAKELILDDVPPTEVYEKVGFNDYSNFYRSFVKITGFSPKDTKK